MAGQDIQASRNFQLLFTNAEEEKKIFCQCILIGGGGGQAIHIQGFPQRAKWMVLNLQINEKHSPGN